jgi:AcrR family transcriptional regulator
MSPRTQEQFEKMRESRRQQIMDAALELFAHEGFNHCTIAMLASHAGISKGLMYNYFKNKEELLSAIIRDGLEEIMDLFDPDRDGVLTSRELENFIRKVFEAMRRNMEFWILYAHILFQPSVTEQLKDNPVVSILDHFAPLLEEYFERNGLEDPQLEMLTLSALIEGLGAMMVYSYPTTPIPDVMIKKLENRIVEMFVKPE